MHWLNQEFARISGEVLAQLGRDELYGQALIILAAIGLAWLMARVIARRVAFYRRPPEPGPLYDLRASLHRTRLLVTPIISVVLLGIAGPVSADLVGETWLVRVAQGLAFLFLIYIAAVRYVRRPSIILFVTWVGIPIALLYLFGFLGEVVAYLDSVALEIGNIRVSVYAVLRTLFFGTLLFWIGRASNATGQRVIRAQPALDTTTREVLSKLFGISVFMLVFLLLLNVMGINVTALTVFGGAFGVGLGFGLQQIASNFVSGLIILIDRTIGIGDYIQLEDGRAGTLREMNMRSATLETFDGKDIMVPNERFITTAFVNWTHRDLMQRHVVRFPVAYATDIAELVPIVRAAVESHPLVLKGGAVPAARHVGVEIESFGPTGINMLVRFWIEGIDDGDHRVSPDLLMRIWAALKEHDIQLPPTPAVVPRPPDRVAMPPNDPGPPV